MIGVCGLLAVLLVYAAGIDPLTAYLATSPGGMDAVAIIAASSNVDIAFVMAMQSLRFLIVLVTGPPLARFIAKRIGLRTGEISVCRHLRRHWSHGAASGRVNGSKKR